MIVFVDVLGFGITIPVLPLFAQDTFKAAPLQITLLQSVYFLAQFIASPQLGRWSDRLGRRPILLVSQAGTLIAFLISGSAQWLWMLYLARVIDGFTGGNISVAQAYLSDITDEKNRAQGIGIVNAAFGTGFLFGPAFGALMASFFGPRLPYFVAAGVSLLTVSLTFFKLPESLTAERRARMKPRDGSQKKSRLEFLRLPGVGLLMVIAFFGQVAFFSFQSIWALWADKVLFAELSPQAAQTGIGLILSVVGFTGVLTQALLVKPIVRRFGERTMIAGGMFIRSLPWLLMAFAPVIALIGVTAPLISFGNGLIVPGLIAILTYLVPPDERGYAIGLSESIQGLGRISAPLIAGWLFENVSPGSPLLFAGLVGVFSAGLALLLWRLPVASKPT
jgi:DHA1 family tetracycline resistance protein-like MFS transporter